MPADAGRASRLLSVTFGPARLHSAFAITHHVNSSRYIFISLAVAVVAFAAAWGLAALHFWKKVDNIVAMSWGDGKYGAAFYGARVYLDPKPAGYSVRAIVHIGRGNDIFHDCGELGTVTNDAEAVARWGQITWAEDGLHIGAGTNAYFLPRAKLESHR